MRDRNGRLVAEPLLLGASQCRFHLSLVATNPAKNATANDIIIVYLDFETTGLDALSDEIVEFGAIAAHCGARFASTVQPLKLPDPEEQTVHGIGADELETSPGFRIVLARFAEFLDQLRDNALSESGADSSDFDSQPTLPRVKQQPPNILLTGHNLKSFDLPFLANQMLRHDVPLETHLATWIYADTLALSKALPPLMQDGCAKLQCLGRGCATSARQAHRALDDVIVLRDVVEAWAARLGVDAANLLAPLAFQVDAQETRLRFACLTQS